ncbi:MAG: hypothetical protein ACI4JS_01665 [Oscillospiraceae bacterium]
MNNIEPKTEFDLYDIPCEEDKDGLLNPTFEDYGRKQMTMLEKKAVDLMNEIDPTALDMINMSGLYLTIWKEIGAKAESARETTENNLLKQTKLSTDYNEQVTQRETIRAAAEAEAWETLRMCVNWLSAEVHRLKMLKEIGKIRLNITSTTE